MFMERIKHNFIQVRMKNILFLCLIKWEHFSPFSEQQNLEIKRQHSTRWRGKKRIYFLDILFYPHSHFFFLLICFDVYYVYVIAKWSFCHTSFSFSFHKMLLYKEDGITCTCYMLLLRVWIFSQSFFVSFYFVYVDSELVSAITGL